MSSSGVADPCRAPDQRSVVGERELAQAVEVGKWGGGAVDEHAAAKRPASRRSASQNAQDAGGDHARPAPPLAPTARKRCRHALERRRIEVEGSAVGDAGRNPMLVAAAMTVTQSARMCQPRRSSAAPCPGPSKASRWYPRASAVAPLRRYSSSAVLSYPLTRITAARRPGAPLVNHKYPVAIRSYAISTASDRHGIRRAAARNASVCARLQAISRGSGSVPMSITPAVRY